MPLNVVQSILSASSSMSAQSSAKRLGPVPTAMGGESTTWPRMRWLRPPQYFVASEWNVTSMLVYATPRESR